MSGNEGLRRLGVSLGESGSFVRGKSEFTVRKVRRAENGRFGAVLENFGSLKIVYKGARINISTPTENRTRN